MRFSKRLPLSKRDNFFASYSNRMNNKNSKLLFLSAALSNFKREITVRGEKFYLTAIHDKENRQIRIGLNGNKINA